MREQATKTRCKTKNGRQVEQREQRQIDCSDRFSPQNTDQQDDRQRRPQYGRERRVLFSWEV